MASKGRHRRAAPAQVISFADVTVQFSPEEWQMLSRAQRRLYWEVTTDNFSSLSFLGLVTAKPPLVSGSEEEQELGRDGAQRCPHSLCSGSCVLPAKHATHSNSPPPNSPPECDSGSECETSVATAALPPSTSPPPAEAQSPTWEDMELSPFATPYQVLVSHPSSASTEAPGAKRRAPDWGPPEILDFIDIWGQERIQSLLSLGRRNRATFELMAKEMRRRGHNRTAEECQRKARKLRVAYRSAQRESQVSGSVPASFPYFELLHTIFEVKVPSDPAKLAQSLSIQRAQDSQCATMIGSQQEEQKPVIGVPVFPVKAALQNNGPVVKSPPDCDSGSECETSVARATLPPSASPQLGGAHSSRRSPVWKEVGLSLLATPDQAVAPKPGSSSREATSAKKRAPDWGPAETLDFISIWGEEGIQSLLSLGRRNRVTFGLMAKEMQRQGHHRTVEECQRKARKLRQVYRSALGESQDSGTVPASCPYFEQLHAIFQGKLSSASARAAQSPSVPCSEDSQSATTPRSQEEDQKPVTGACVLPMKPVPQNNASAPNSPQQYDSGSECETSVMEPIHFLSTSPQRDGTPGSEKSPPWKDEFNPFDPPFQAMTSHQSSASTETTYARRRAPDWGPAETLDFIDIWGEDRIQSLLSLGHRKRATYELMAKEMRWRGHKRGPDECQRKAKKLRLAYRSALGECQGSGFVPSSCPYFEQLHAIFLGKASSEPTRLAQSVSILDSQDASALGIHQEDRKPAIGTGVFPMKPIFQNSSPALSSPLEYGSGSKCETSMVRPILPPPASPQRDGTRGSEKSPTWIDAEMSPFGTAYQAMAPHQSFSSMETTGAKRRAPDWGPAETLDFIDIWGKERIQSLLRLGRRNRSTFELMAKEMQWRGHNRAPDECQRKAKKLRLAYQSAQRENQGSGTASAPCPYFEQLHAIFQGKASSGPARLAQSPSVPDFQDSQCASTSGTLQDDQQPTTGLSMLPPKLVLQKNSAALKSSPEWDSGSKYETSMTRPVRLTLGSPQLDRTRRRKRSPMWEDVELAPHQAIVFPHCSDAMETTYTKRRAPDWAPAETLDFIDIWGQERIQSLLSLGRHNRATFELIAKEMQWHGHHRTVEECQRKAKKLRLAYRSALCKSQGSGNAPLSCPYFEQLHAVFQGKVSSAPAHLVQSLSSPYSEDSQCATMPRSHQDDQDPATGMQARPASSNEFMDDDDDEEEDEEDEDDEEAPSDLEQQGDRPLRTYILDPEEDDEVEEVVVTDDVVELYLLAEDQAETSTEGHLQDQHPSHVGGASVAAITTTTPESTAESDEVLDDDWTAGRTPPESPTQELQEEDLQAFGRESQLSSGHPAEQMGAAHEDVLRLALAQSQEAAGMMEEEEASRMEGTARRLEMAEQLRGMTHHLSRMLAAMRELVSFTGPEGARLQAPPTPEHSSSPGAIAVPGPELANGEEHQPPPC